MKHLPNEDGQTKDFKEKKKEALTHTFLFLTRNALFLFLTLKKKNLIGRRIKLQTHMKPIKRMQHRLCFYFLYLNNYNLF